MSPIETAELRATTVMLRPDQIGKVDEIKARQQSGSAVSVSRSDVIRDALDRGLAEIESEMAEGVA